MEMRTFTIHGNALMGMWEVKMLENGTIVDKRGNFQTEFAAYEFGKKWTASRA